MIDDIAIRAPRLLRDFLASDTDRWEREATLQGAVVFRKLGDAVIPADDWVSQPWSNTLVSRARVLVRLRTRLRRLAGRS